MWLHYSRTRWKWLFSRSLAGRPNQKTPSAIIDSLLVSFTCLEGRHPGRDFRQFASVARVERVSLTPSLFLFLRLTHVYVHSRRPSFPPIVFSCDSFAGFVEPLYQLTKRQANEQILLLTNNPNADR